MDMKLPVSHYFPKNIDIQRTTKNFLFSPFEELKNIEYWVAWFLAKVQGLSSPILELHEVLKAKSTKTVQGGI
jgi:hypothetical protein